MYSSLSYTLGLDEHVVLYFKSLDVGFFIARSVLVQELNRCPLSTMLSVLCSLRRNKNVQQVGGALIELHLKIYNYSMFITVTQYIAMYHSLTKS